MKKKSDKPDEITRVDVWLVGYWRKKKDGDEDIEDPEVVENNNIADDKVVPQKRKEVSDVSISSKQFKISKGEKQGRLVENVNKQTPQMQHVLLLRWYGTDEKIVAFGDLASKDPDDKVHCIRLGTGVWKVWVREVIEDIALYRQTEEFSTLSAANGSTVAWPSEYVKLF